MLITWFRNAILGFPDRFVRRISTTRKIKLESGRLHICNQQFCKLNWSLRVNSSANNCTEKQGSEQFTAKGHFDSVIIPFPFILKLISIQANVSLTFFSWTTLHTSVQRLYCRKCLTSLAPLGGVAESCSSTVDHGAGSWQLKDVKRSCSPLLWGLSPYSYWQKTLAVISLVHYKLRHMQSLCVRLPHNYFCSIYSFRNDLEIS